MLRHHDHAVVPVRFAGVAMRRVATRPVCSLTPCEATRHRSPLFSREYGSAGAEI
jgi:hypothetical protein